MTPRLLEHVESEPTAGLGIDTLTACLCRICERTCATMVAKCLSARTSTLNRVLEAMLLFTELEQGDKVSVSVAHRHP